jgi:hypothetical protein
VATDEALCALDFADCREQVVPCHRAIGTGRSLTGYAGGVERKRWLLRHAGVGDLSV